MIEKTKIGLDSKWGESSPFHEPALLAGFKPRANDVLITTAPKAGTTWMQQILHQMRTKGDDTFSSIFEVVPWLEFPRPDLSIEEQLAHYEQIPSPRIFKTHCTYAQTPSVDTVRIVLSSRDPRDCCISFYHHQQGLTEEAWQEKEIHFIDAFDAFFERWLDYAAWFRNIQSWWLHKEQQNVLWLRYEDMKRDLPEAVNRLSHFLAWPLTERQRVKVLEHCSFDWMKARSSRFTTMAGQNKPHFKQGAFIRKGVVGDYKSLLSEAQEARIMAKAREMLAVDCLEFLDL
ncbi:MAG: sulfotransferase [Gammaproteobacteria bacterium]|nr:sulfotransferase domain-containing protein [bacterium AH-315-E07]PCH61078.1 MAG: sulfotransferase [Gammaproteobacteria bacterium]